MTPSAVPSYAGYRFPAEVISHAVWLYFRFLLSLRMVDELLAARGIIVSHETVRQWALSTCWIEVAMARDKEGVLVVTPWRRRRWSRPKPERPRSGRLDTAWRAPGDGGGGRGC